MARVTVEILGDEELRRKLRGLRRQELRRPLSRAARAEARKVLLTARSVVPVDTGALRRGLRVRAIRRSRRRIGFQVQTPKRRKLGITRSGYYPSAVEYGFRHARSGRQVPARPYIRPAFERNVEAAKRAMRSEATRVVTQELRR